VIKEELLRILKNYPVAHPHASAIWGEVEKAYSANGRHYHNLGHLDQILGELNEYRSQFACWHAVVFATAYHDIIYNVLKDDNEDRSAELASDRLAAITFPVEDRRRCVQMILATKGHEAVDAEVNLFTDADLSILGSDQETYLTYTRQIRLEYSIVPDAAYISGRRKVIKRFLNMERIYKSKEFFEKYELFARRNLQNELGL
jgi:predicted metal-dependent HD superfamily phosphohydrolase